MDKTGIKTDEVIVEEFYQRLVRRWPIFLSAVLVSVLVGVAVVFGGRSLYRHFNHNPALASKPAKSTHSVASKPSSGSKTTTKSSSTASGTAQASLPNSGPGQVFEIFAIASLAAGIGHYVITNRPNRARI